jgi:hypothetical protein
MAVGIVPRVSAPGVRGHRVVVDDAEFGRQYSRALTRPLRQSQATMRLGRASPTELHPSYKPATQEVATSNAAGFGPIATGFGS